MLSVHLSVTLVICGHKGLVTSKAITRIISLGSSLLNTQNKPMVNYWMDFIEKMSSRRLENSVNCVTYQIFNTFQKIIKCNEWTLSLNVRVSVQANVDNFYPYDTI